MGRLEDVLRRAEERKKMTSRKAALILCSIVIVGTIVAELFTNLGTPKAPPPPDMRGLRVDDIKLMSPADVKRLHQIDDAHRAAEAADAKVQATPSSPAH